MGSRRSGQKRTRRRVRAGAPSARRERFAVISLRPTSGRSCVPRPAVHRSPKTPSPLTGVAEPPTIHPDTRKIQARPIFDRLTALADPTRSRLLLLLDRHELTVGELCVALQLPQSTVSRHLKTLADEGWVSARAEGTSRRYAMSDSALDPSARGAWPNAKAWRAWMVSRSSAGHAPGSRHRAGETWDREVR